MRIERLDKRDFAFGLSWVDSSLSVADAIETKAQDAAVWYYAFSNKAESSYTVGFTEAPIKGKVASYAATLASIAEDGIYVAEVESGDYWYVNIHANKVVAGTDVTVSAADVADVIGSLRDTLNVPLFVHGSAVEGYYGARDWDPVKAVRTAKPAWLKKHSGTGSSPAQALAAVLILSLGLGGVYAGYSMLAPEPVLSAGPSPEEIRAMYLQSVRTAIGQIPAEPEWFDRATATVRGFPMYKAGWAMESASCAQLACSASYQQAPGSPWSSADLLLEAGSGSIRQDGAAGGISAPVPGLVIDPTDDEILRYPVAQTGVNRLVGLLGLRFPGVLLQGSPSRVRIDPQTEQRPPEAMPIYRVELTVFARSVPELGLMSRVNAFFAEHGFRPVNINMSYGVGTQASGWVVQYTRLTGE